LSLDKALGGTNVEPILPDKSKSITLRVIFVGNIYKDGKITDQKTAAIIDVKLKFLVKESKALKWGLEIT